MRSLISLYPITFVFALGLVLMGCDQAVPTAESPEAKNPATTSAAAKASPGAPNAAVYRADLQPLNESGVQGQALFTVRNGTFSAKVNAVGAEPNQIHAQHIHAKLGAQGGVSTCPTIADDENKDGLLQVGEGVPSYGGIAVPLDGSLDVAEGLGDPETFPTADNQGGAITYRETVAVSDLAINGGGGFEALTLEEHAVVVHGLTVGGKYQLTLPVACGTIERVN